MADETANADMPTEENTAPETDMEVAGEQVDFTMAPGTTEAPASSSDGTESEDSSADSTTSPSPTETKPKPEEDADAADVSDADADDAGEGDDAKDAATEPQEQNVDALKSLDTADAEGEGPTHTGTDTPETLVSRPADPCTGRALDGSMDTKGVIVGGSGTLSRGAAHPEMKEPVALPFDSDTKDDDVGAKVDEAIGILQDVRGSL